MKHHTFKVAVNTPDLKVQMRWRRDMVLLFAARILVLDRFEHNLKKKTDVYIYSQTHWNPFSKLVLSLSVSYRPFQTIFITHRDIQSL